MITKKQLEKSYSSSMAKRLDSLDLRSKPIKTLSQKKSETSTKCPFNLNSFSDNRSFSETLHNKSNKVSN